MACASFLGALTGVALGPFLPTIARDMNVPVPLLGQGAAGTLLLAAVLGIFVGPLADRYGRRRLLLVGHAAVAGCGCATASARGYPALLGAQALGAVAVASLEGVSLAEAGSRFAGRARRSAITGAIASVTVGLILVAIGNALLIGLSADGNVYVETLPGVVVFALGGGPLFVCATTSALDRAGQHEAGVVSGVVYTFHELGAAICVAVASTVAAAGLTRTPSIDGFTDAFTVFTIAAAVAAVLSLRLVPPGK